MNLQAVLFLKLYIDKVLFWHSKKVVISER